MNAEQAELGSESNGVRQFDTRYPILGHAKTMPGPFNDDDVVASDAIKGIPLTYLTE